MQFSREHLSACPFSSPELIFVNWLFQPMPEDMFLRCQEALLFLAIVHSEALLLGEYLFACVCTHTLFVVAGTGLFRKRSGFPMGANAAPPFVNLIHRYYEILTPLPSGFGLMHDRLIKKPKPACRSVHIARAIPCVLGMEFLSPILGK